jgi:hypothetical protein
MYFSIPYLKTFPVNFVVKVVKRLQSGPEWPLYFSCDKACSGNEQSGNRQVM